MNFFLVVINIATGLWRQGITLLLPHRRKHTIECYFRQTYTHLLKPTNVNTKTEGRHDDPKQDYDVME